MPDFKDDKLGDAFTALNKTGHVMRSPQLDKLAPLAADLHRSFDGEVLYDIYYDGKGLESLSFTEIFSQGLLIHPCNDELRYGLARLALTDDDEPVPAEKILAAGDLDKYRLIRNFDSTPLEAVVFLPGSNLLDKVVDWGKVGQLVDDGAMVKLHPVTATAFERRISQMFPGRVIGRRQSGFGALTRAKSVYTTVNSEMGLLAILMDKKVGMVDLEPVAKRPIYRQLYDVVLPESNQKAALEKLMGSRHAGFYWHWQDASRCEQIVTAIREVANA